MVTALGLTLGLLSGEAPAPEMTCEFWARVLTGPASGLGIGQLPRGDEVAYPDLANAGWKSCEMTAHMISCTAPASDFTAAARQLSASLQECLPAARFYRPSGFDPLWGGNQNIEGAGYSILLTWGGDEVPDGVRFYVTRSW